MENIQMGYALQRLVSDFDDHFKWNDKAPKPEKVDFWFNLQTASWSRAMRRKGLRAIETHIQERFKEKANA